MRVSLTAVLGVLVLTISMMVTWSNDVESQGITDLTQKRDRADTASQTEASDGGCEIDQSTSLPGYYRCKKVDGEWRYRYWNGTVWVGPLVDEGIDDLYARVIDEVGPEAFEAVWFLLGGDADALQFAFILFAWYISISELVEPATLVPGSPVPSSSPTPRPLPAQSPASEGTARLSPNYRFVWSWGSTIGGFDGSVAGDAGGWTYAGTSIGSWPQRLHAEGGTARCTFEGDPEADMPESGWPMDCDLFWQGDATWTGQIDGRFYPIRDETGAMIDFEFKGLGHGTDGGDWSPIEVTLEPCEPEAVC